jgi:hypothetical protein
MLPSDATYNEALALYGSPIPLHERRFLARFSIGRTF